MIATVRGRPEASTVSISLAVDDTAASTIFNHVVEPLNMEASVDLPRMAGNLKGARGRSRRDSIAKVAYKGEECWQARRVETRGFYSRKVWNGTAAELAVDARQSCSVSYTHLTLPTIYSV